MKIAVEFDDDGVIYDVIDSITLSLLRNLHKSMKTSTAAWHPDDKAMEEKIIAACEVLIEYYGGNDGKPE